MYAPLFVATPTADGVILAAANALAPLDGTLRYRRQGDPQWLTLEVHLPAGPENDPAAGVDALRLTGLFPDTRYEFQLVSQGKPVDGGAGSFMTQRLAAAPFSFGIMADAHVNPANPERNHVLRNCADALETNHPDLVVHVGDNIQTIGSSHGGPATDPKHPIIFYIYWRQILGSLQSNAAQYVLNGNWEGENGWHSERNKAWARTARMALAPAPDDATHPQGGSPHQDYYAFTWGEALFVMLNATGYTTTNHEHTVGEGLADDWTLGDAQLDWLQRTLATATAPWKFLFIHHSVGGNAGDEVNSRYGRGGGRAAHVGEQARVHDLMRRHGVQAFFYGHDHVFTDMVVDGIHYICCGSCGAPWKFTTEETGYETYIPDSGFVLVDVHSDTATVRYLRPEKDKAEGAELYTTTLSRITAGNS